MSALLRRVCITCEHAKAPIYKCKCGEFFCSHRIKKHEATCYVAKRQKTERRRKRTLAELKSKTWPASITGDVGHYSVSNYSLKAIADKLDAIGLGLAELLERGQ